ncbi:hypothetical protein SEA_LUCHADOR_82 [Mycobacterium phage Luchador]|uniref:Uncharacterized protein n=1 Tax=Mycobacterium phage Luchador TaxID=1647300 RepID=A0A0F6WDT8_9CAUD|nr:site-specific recombination directionality factor RDF [Mycobacterium phage Luchador]AKF14246.1 hypothetical protein SEA_LUCHADOR_82 [Mycobacterium phage Luchador]
MRAGEGLLVAVGMAVAGLVYAWPAAAAPMCETRSEAHQIEHGGFATDSAWHVAHGDLPTCSEPDGGSSGHQDSNDDDCFGRCNKWWRND